MLTLRRYLRWGMWWIGDLCVKVICHRLSCNFVDIKLACLDTKHFSSQTRHWPWEHWPYLQATMYYLAYSINAEKFLMIRKVNFKQTSLDWEESSLCNSFNILMWKSNDMSVADWWYQTHIKKLLQFYMCAVKSSFKDRNPCKTFQFITYNLFIAILNYYITDFYQYAHI